jgi:hypothetical protein
MPALRTSKVKENRNNLVDRISRNGFKMPSYAFCRRDPRRVCVVSSDSDRCLECVRQNKAQCDVWGPTTQQWAALEREEDRLKNEWRATQEAQRLLQEEHQRLFERLLESQAKLLRLDKQREMFRDRAAEMLRRGLKSLDELDALEKKEREEASRRSEALATSSASAEASVDPSFLPDSFWEGLDFVGETPSVAPDN